MINPDRVSVVHNGFHLVSPIPAMLTRKHILINIYVTGSPRIIICSYSTDSDRIHDSSVLALVDFVDIHNSKFITVSQQTLSRARLNKSAFSNIFILQCVPFYYLPKIAQWHLLLLWWLMNFEWKRPITIRQLKTYTYFFTDCKQIGYQCFAANYLLSFGMYKKNCRFVIVNTCFRQYKYS